MMTLCWLEAHLQFSAISAIFNEQNLEMNIDGVIWVSFQTPLPQSLMLELTEM